jgi:uncharacterized protein
MARRLLRRYLPDFNLVRNHKHLRFLGSWMHDPNLWHLNRNSVSKAFAVGLFWAFIPIPLQSIPSALFAIYFRANLPISVMLVWITNPVTIPPILYFCYRLGAWILNTPPQSLELEISWHWIGNEFLRIWQPFLLGCLLTASTMSLLGYYGMHMLWRWNVVRDWERRRSKLTRARKPER